MTPTLTGLDEMMETATTTTTTTSSEHHATTSRGRIRKRRQLSELEGAQQATTMHLYRVDWQAPERGVPQQQQQQPIQLVAFPPASMQQIQQQMQSSPAKELSFQEISPFPETIWSYTVFLGGVLACWILYLLVPRGYRKRYCNANRKRYARRTDAAMPPAGYWLPANQTMSDVGVGAVGDSTNMNMNMNMNAGSALSQQRSRLPPILQASSTMSSYIATPTGAATASPSSQQNIAASFPPAHLRPASPEHPALKKIPSNKIIAETMGRLQGRGIRLVAHGVHCDPKRVWIKLDDDTKSVTWQTEFPRRVPNQSGQVSIVLMRGSVHRIALTNVLYIDVGKKTNALQQLNETKVPDSSCFSLLTQNGSLDLQANSKLERDALVSCFSMILDDIHANEDWRALYEASPDPSLANSSVGNGNGNYTNNTNNSGGRGAAGISNNSNSNSKQKYPNPSDLLVEV